jgi:glycosyltransferase involved in cell wall biosynthesis
VKVSIILCTYNPREDYLRRVLAALAAQTLESSAWELLLVDNASHPSVPMSVLDGLTNAHLIREDEPGKPHALMTGIKLSKADMLVTVDDDNVLSSDYLANLVRLGQEQPNVGVFSASISAEFEAPPAPGVAPYLLFLAIRELTQDVIGTVSTPHASPIGAGMGFRRVVAEAYLEDMRNEPAMLSMGRSGSSQVGGADDSAFGYAAARLGLRCGAFRILKLVHLMPANRLEESALRNLAESLTYSHTKMALIKELDEVSKWRLIKWRIGLLVYRLHPNPAWGCYCRAVIQGKLRAGIDFLASR